MPDIRDNRFSTYPVDGRFAVAGQDWRFATPGLDARFPTPGVDRRWEGSEWAFPSTLFAGGKAGFALGGVDLHRLWQDAGGTVPVTGVGQPVGRVERAAGTVDASQATALSRPALGRWPQGAKARNLLKGSGDFASPLWLNSGMDSGLMKTKTTDGTKIVYTLDGTTSASGVRSITSSSFRNGRIRAGDKITVRVLARVGSGDFTFGPVEGFRFDISIRGETGGEVDYKPSVLARPVGTEIVELKQTITINSDGHVGINIGPRFEVGTVVNNVPFEFSEVQVEIGETATPYQPTDADGVPLLGYGAVRLLQNRNVFDAIPLGLQTSGNNVNGFGTSLSSNGIAVDVIDRGYEDGEPYLIVKCSGVSTSTNTLFMNVSNTDSFAISNNAVTVRVKLTLLEGSLVTDGSGPSLRTFANFMRGGVSANGSAYAWTPSAEEVVVTTIISSNDGLPVDAVTTRGVYLRVPVGAAVDATVKIKALQINEGISVTPFQTVYGPNNITEPNVPDVYFLANDGNDALPATLPAGTYGIAWANVAGGVTFTTQTLASAGTIDALRGTRVADVVIRQGDFTAAEKAEIEAKFSRFAV